jgi:hypothetical protein
VGLSGSLFLYTETTVMHTHFSHVIICDIHIVTSKRLENARNVI